MDTKGRLAVVGLVALASSALGCDDETSACCTEDDFQVGGDISLGGEAGVALQAVADIAAITSTMVDNLTAACRTMAEDLDVPKEERDAAEQSPDSRAKLQAFCNLAVAAISSLDVSITVNFQPSVCGASVNAKAACQAMCSGNTSCDTRANPPTCEGGRLEIACKGNCTAGGSVSCEGTCTGSCEGACTAEGGVDCAGRCEGTCIGSTDNQGNCMGQCNGTCQVTAPSAHCSGTCQGQCDATCQGSAELAVKCDGSCDADYEALKCTGGELKGGCAVAAKCEANCDASVRAKAECRRPVLTIDVSGGASAEVRGKVKLALEENLGLVAGIAARVQVMFSIFGIVVAYLPEQIGETKAACIPLVISAIGDAAADIEAMFGGTAIVVGAVGM